MSSLNLMTQFQSSFDSTPSVSVEAAAESLAKIGEEIYGSHPSNQSALAPRQPAPPAPSHLSPWILAIAYPLGRFGLFPAYFGTVEITGQENLPRSGPVILAPTHRSRWDALMIPFVAGYHVTGRHLRFMVSADEVTGIQGWFIQRMGGFPINTRQPAIASLRHGVELLAQGETLVIFPEGNIYREAAVQPLKPGLARLAIQAETSHPNLGVQVVPMNVQYHNPSVPWGCRVTVNIGQPLAVADYCTGHGKQDAKTLTTSLATAMDALGTVII